MSDDQPTPSTTAAEGVVSPDGVLSPGEFPVLSPDALTGVEGQEAVPGDGEASVPDVSSPATVIRIGAMAKQLLEELRQTEMDEPARDQLRRIYESSVDQLQSALSPELAEELERLAFVFGPDATPSDAELRLAEAQLVGWLEGLFHGIQATLFAQQLAARQQLEQMRQLPSSGNSQQERPGTYI